MKKNNSYKIFVITIILFSICKTFAVNNLQVKQLANIETQDENNSVLEINEVQVSNID